MSEPLTNWDIFFRIMTFAWPLGLIIFKEFFIDGIKNYFQKQKKEKKEKEKFLEIKKQMPEIIKIILDGLENRPLQVYLCFVSIAGRFDMLFGDKSEPCSKELKNNYRYHLNCLESIGAGKCNKERDGIDFYPEFLEKLKKYGHLK